MTTPEIKDLIQPLEQYMTPDQKAELENILSIGKKWKEEGEQKKEEFRKKNNRDKFVQQILNYPEKKNMREKQNKELLEEI
jgi:hypothetical protein